MKTANFVLSDELVERFRKLHNGNWLSHLFLYFAEYAYNTARARRELWKIVAGSVWVIGEVLRNRCERGEKVNFKQEDLLIGGVMTRMPRIEEENALDIALTIVKDMKAQLRTGNLTFYEYTVCLRNERIFVEPKRRR